MADLPVSGEWTNAGPELPIATTTVPVSVAPLPKKLNIVLPFIEVDTPQVINLLKWCAQLSGKLPYSIFLLPFKGINFTEVKMYAERAFSDVQVIPDAEGVISDWRTDSQVRDAAGPNSMFRQAAWYFYFHQALGPWLYLEPDCVPLKPDWIAQLEADHNSSGAAISGVSMDVGDLPYLNGVAIYPSSVINVAPELVTRVMWQQHGEMEVAFDIAGGRKVLDKSHLTNKIQLGYRVKWYDHPDFDFTPTAVLFHGDRDGSLIKALQTNTVRKGGDTNGTNSAETTTGTETASTAARTTTGINLDQGEQRGVEKLETHLAHNKENAGSSPAPASSRKEGDAECNAPVGNAIARQAADTPSVQSTEQCSNGAADVQPVASAMSIGETIRFHCDALLKIETDRPSRKQQITYELRKRRLVPQARKHKR